MPQGGGGAEKEKRQMQVARVFPSCPALLCKGVSSDGPFPSPASHPSPQPSSARIPHLSPLPHPCAATAGSLPPLGCFPGGGRQRFPWPVAQGSHRGPALFRAPLLAHIQVSGQVSYLPGLGPSVRAGKPVTIPGGKARALLRREARGQELEPGPPPGCRPPPGRAARTPPPTGGQRLNPAPVPWGQR